METTQSMKHAASTLVIALSGLCCILPACSRPAPSAEKTAQAEASPTGEPRNEHGGGSAIESVYTMIDDKSCKTVDESDEGNYAKVLCPGYEDYPVTLYDFDARSSVYYGFHPREDPPYETFYGFNGAGNKVEWRLETVNGHVRPFATILRWSAVSPPDSQNTIDVLVIAKVAQKEDRSSCVVGLVLASGNPRANEQARQIADRDARDFQCGIDLPDAQDAPPFTSAASTGGNPQQSVDIRRWEPSAKSAKASLYSLPGGGCRIDATITNAEGEWDYYFLFGKNLRKSLGRYYRYDAGAETSSDPERPMTLEKTVTTDRPDDARMLTAKFVFYKGLFNKKNFELCSD